MGRWSDRSGGSTCTWNDTTTVRKSVFFSVFVFVSWKSSDDICAAQTHWSLDRCQPSQRRMKLCFFVRSSRRSRQPHIQKRLIVSTCLQISKRRQRKGQFAIFQQSRAGCQPHIAHNNRLFVSCDHWLTTNTRQLGGVYGDAPAFSTMSYVVSHRNRFIAFVCLPMRGATRSTNRNLQDAVREHAERR